MNIQIYSSSDNERKAARIQNYCRYSQNRQHFENTEVLNVYILLKY